MQSTSLQIEIVMEQRPINVVKVHTDDKDYTLDSIHVRSSHSIGSGGKQSTSPHSKGLQVYARDGTMHLILKVLLNLKVLLITQIACHSQRTASVTRLASFLIELFYSNGLDVSAHNNQLYGPKLLKGYMEKTKIGKHVRSHHQSLWLDIVKEVHHIQRQGTDLMGFIHRKMGNGVDIRFWEDKWRGDNTFQYDFPRMYALETQKNISVALKLSHDNLLCSFRRTPRAGAEELQYIQLVKIMEGITLFDSKDRWRWSLEGCGEFTVASVRNLLDANSLPVVSSKTRWIKAVPIKVNIHAWKVKLDILPTRLNISKRGMDIESILCPLCEKNVESSSHIFFTCPISREIFRKVLLWWEIDVVMVSSYDEWLEWLLSIRLHSKHKELFEGVCYVLWWYIWNFRNKSIFGSACPSKALIFEE
ncbi:RNA-directed DNA polymerase, eukaryota, reverse transcriptase zinc-binding domain protein, partial [Tanacetum coccineum]